MNGHTHMGSGAGGPHRRSDADGAADDCTRADGMLMPQLRRALPLASLDSMLYDTVTRAAVTMFAAATERSVPQGVAVRYRLWLPVCPCCELVVAMALSCLYRVTSSVGSSRGRSDRTSKSNSQEWYPNMSLQFPMTTQHWLLGAPASSCQTAPTHCNTPNCASCPPRGRGSGREGRNKQQRGEWKTATATSAVACIGGSRALRSDAGVIVKPGGL